MATILIVDDSADDRRMLELLLRSYTPAHVLSAGNAPDGIALAPQADVIMLDVMMPGMDGIEAFEILRKSPETKNTPIIFMTAYPQSILDRFSGQALGSIDYLVKPVQKDPLLNRISIHLGVHDARQRLQAQKLSERDQLSLLLAALQQSADGITVTDRGGKWIMINPAEAKMFGYGQQEFLEKDIKEIYETASANRIRAEIIPILEKQDHWEGELVGRKQSGEAFPILLSLATVKDNSGKFLGIMGFTKDITPLKKAYQDLSQAQEALVRSERMKALGEMVGGIAHEFNNLLAGILGNTQILLQTAKDPGLAKRLRTIERAALTGAEEVKRLQTFTLASAGSERKLFVLKEILQEALLMTRPRWRDLTHKKGITIEVETDLGECPPLEGDEENLRIAVINIIFNAIDALPQGGKIRARCWADKSFAYLQIADTGVGMKPEVLERAFEPYFTTQRPLKSGLGLSVAYGTVKKHQGNIELKSEAGRGTTATIKLPLGAAKAGAAAGPLEGKPATPSVRIMIVEDDPTVASLLTDILSRGGWTVKTSDQPVAALKEAENGDFNLVIVDLGMPAMNGLEFSRRVKASAARTKVALITGWDVPPGQGELDRAGVDVLWRKPFNVDEIFTRVSDLLSR
jgi:PAS domain S-box-containing protein